MRVIPVIIIVFITLIFTGCSTGGRPNPITPIEMNEQQLDSNYGSAGASGNSRGMIGLWDIYISADRTEIDVIPQRAGTGHFNLVYFLENSPCNDCLTLQNFMIVSPNELTVNLKITHPFPGMPTLTCFDPRGIVISKGDTFFPGWWLNCTMGPDELVLLNPDGYTSLFNPTDFPQDDPVNPLLKYVPGKYQINGLLNATLNPFVAYQKGSPRRMLTSGSTSVQSLHVKLPPGPIVFGYAIDVSWSPAIDEITDPEEDFPVEANCLEPYRIDVDVDGSLNAAPGSFVDVNVTVYDHQGIDTVSVVQMYAPYVFNGEISLEQTGTQGDNIGYYSGTILNQPATVEGEFGLLVRIIGTEPDPIHGNILAYQLVRLAIGEPMGSPGWALSWGGLIEGSGAEANHVDVDHMGNILLLVS